MQVYDQHKTIKEAFEKIVAMSDEITKTVIFVSNLLSVDPPDLVLVDQEKLLAKISDSRIDHLEQNSCQNDSEENSDISVTSTTASVADKDGHKKARKAANTIHEEQSEDEINSSTINESSKEVLGNDKPHESTKRNETVDKVTTVKREYLENKPFLIKLEPEEYEPFAIKQEATEENMIISKDLSANERSIKSENAYTLSDNVSENMAYFNREAENFIKMTDSVLKNNNANETLRKNGVKYPDLLPHENSNSVHPKNHLNQDRLSYLSHVSPVKLNPISPILPPLPESINQPPSQNDKNINSTLIDKLPSNKSARPQNMAPSKESSSFISPNKIPLRKVCSTTIKPFLSPDQVPSRVDSSPTTKPSTSLVGTSSKIKPSTFPEKCSTRVESSSTVKPSVLPEKSSIRVEPSSSIKQSTTTNKASSRVVSSTIKSFISPVKAPSREEPYLTFRRTSSTNNPVRRKHYSGNKRPLCKDYNDKGSCLRGKLCQFYHGFDALSVPQYVQSQHPHGFFTTSGAEKSYPKRLRKERILSPLQNGEWRKKSGKGKEKTLVKRSSIKNEVIEEDLEVAALEELLRIRKEELLRLDDANGMAGKGEDFEVEEGEIC